MTEGLYRFQDPVDVIAVHLDAFYPGLVWREEPDGPDWDRGQVLILVKDAGGSGIHAHQWQDARISIEVRSRGQALASEVAFEVEAKLRQMEYQLPGVRFVDAVSLPVHWPLPEERVHGYFWTVHLRLKGEPLT